MATNKLKVKLDVTYTQELSAVILLREVFDSGQLDDELGARVADFLKCVDKVVLLKGELIGDIGGEL